MPKDLQNVLTVDTNKVRGWFREKGFELYGSQELILRFIEANLHNEAKVSNFVYDNRTPWGTTTLLTAIFQTHPEAPITTVSYTLDDASLADFPEDRVVTPYLYSFRVRDVVTDTVVLADVSLRVVEKMGNINKDFPSVLSANAAKVIYLGRYRD